MMGVRPFFRHKWARARHFQEPGSSGLVTSLVPRFKGEDKGEVDSINQGKNKGRNNGKNKGEIKAPVWAK